MVQAWSVPGTVRARVFLCVGNGKVEFKYHLAPHDLRVGDTITSGAQGDPTVGNRRKLKDIPDNTQICNIEFVSSNVDQPYQL